MPKTLIICEAGVNHNCCLKTACALCDAAKEAGADAVKWQTWITDKIMTPDNPRYEMLKNLEMPFSFFRDIKSYCDNIGIMFLSTPDDEESLDFLVDELDMSIIKIGSGNAHNWKFVEKAVAKNKPLIISTGMSQRGEVDFIYNMVKVQEKRKRYSRELTLLHCVSLYPTDYNEVNIRSIQSMQDRYKCDIGLSDHTPGIEIPIAAVAMGATVIEKHLTLDRTLPGPDHASSLEPAEFKRMVAAIRNVEAAMGNGIKQPCARELEVRDLYRLKGVQ